MNLVIFSGNLAKDGKLLKTTTGKTCFVSTLALREDMKPETKSATFIDIIIWGDRAEKLAPYLTKGKTISVVGRIEINKNIKDDKTYISPRVVVETLEFLSKKSDQQNKSEVETDAISVSDLEDTVENKTDNLQENNDDEVPF